jgi:hypothetical protein
LPRNDSKGYSPAAKSAGFTEQYNLGGLNRFAETIEYPLRVSRGQHVKPDGNAIRPVAELSQSGSAAS